MTQKETLSEYTKVPTKELLHILETDTPLEYGYGARHVQLVIMLLCLCTSFVARGHLGVTIVAMTQISPENSPVVVLENITDNGNKINESTVIFDKSTQSFDEENNKNIIKYDFDNHNNTGNKSNIHETFEWSKPTQEMVLSSFFLGYILMMFPIGMVTQKWGGKLPLQISLFVNAAVSISTPWLASWGGWKAVCICRIFQGFAQSGTFPSIQALLAKWVPNNELGTLSSYVYTGSTLGTVIAFQISGFLSDSAWGWPSTFWVVGALCLVAFTILTMFGAPSPSEHRYISETEKKYIMGRTDVGEPKKINKVPWKAIITSKSIWACFVAQAGCGTSFFFFFTQVPSYIHYTLGINVRSSGMLSSLPYVASFFTSIAFGLISDLCTNRGVVSVKNARRISNSISQVGISVCLVMATFATNTAFAVACLVVGMGCQMAMHTGWLINHIDLAPNFAATIISMGNIIMNCCVLSLPVLVSQIVVDVFRPKCNHGPWQKILTTRLHMSLLLDHMRYHHNVFHKRNRYQWQIMFGLVAAFALLCNAVYIICMSSDIQPWNDHAKDLSIDDTKPQEDGNLTEKC